MIVLHDIAGQAPTSPVPKAASQKPLPLCERQLGTPSPQWAEGDPKEIPRERPPRPGGRGVGRGEVGEGRMVVSTNLNLH